MIDSKKIEAVHSKNEKNLLAWEETRMVAVRGDGANVTPWRLADEELLDDYKRNLLYETGKIDDRIGGASPVF